MSAARTSTAAVVPAAVAAADLTALLGWELKAEGLCRDDVCVPVRDRAALDAGDGRLSTVAVAGALGLPSALDADRDLVAIGIAPADRAAALHGRVAPDFTLPDLAGTARSLSDWAGSKRLLVAFASW